MATPVDDTACDERDEGTARLLASGDPEGLRRLLADHAGTVLAMLARDFSGRLDRQQIEDALAEAVIRAWRAGARYEPMAPSPGAWLYVIARNRARSLLEPRPTPELVYVASLDDQPAPAGPTAPDEHAIANAGALAADVERCMEKLSDQQRAVLRADLAHGGIAPAGMLAAALHTTRSAIYVARHFGRRALRDALRRCGHAFGVRDRLGEPTRPHS
jgi:DNA-directed RNA polymerase specialized sigma24 family protein